ncbi:hypothetical protein [Pelagovum sp. HNIBRBA483]|uniref:hypothetical protein n=1 Tax=Pelagovum sp. HNIBRBA483 TaxID=3233341 RepID=UPI0034A4B2B6
MRLPDLLFVLFVTCLTLTGLISYTQLTSVYYRNNLLPANALFDLFIVLYVFAVPATRILPVAAPFFLLSTFYILTSAIFLPAPNGGAPSPLDFIISFKAFFYLAILCFARPRKLSISLGALEKVFKYLLMAFFLKYLFSKTILEIPRPGLFTENNFEIVFLLVIFIFLSRCGRLRSKFWAILLLGVVLLSGSRSGLLGLFAALLTSNGQRSMRLIIELFFLFVLVAAVLTLIDNRIVGLMDLASVDRFLFFTLFLEELKRFEVWQYLVGWTPMTPLSDSTCMRMGFYGSLFSSANSDVCYSVVLHVFYFRVILDHGVLGLIFLIAGFYFLLRSNGLNGSLSFAIIIQGLINGLSISGFANTYFFLAVVLVTSHYSKIRTA